MSARSKRTVESVTGRKPRPERALRDAGICVWQWNPTTDEIICSEACAPLFGLAPGTPLGYEKLRRLLHPDDHDRVQEVIQRGLVEGAEYEVECRVIWRDGTERWIGAKGRAHLDSSGKPRLMEGVAQDITGRKRDEAALRQWRDRYEALILASGHILYDWDARTDHVTYSGSFEQALGYSAADMAGGLAHWLEIVHPGDLLAFNAELARSVAGKTRFSLEYRVRHRDGHYLVVQDDGYPIFDAAGNMVGVVGLVADITERKRAEEERLRLSAQLRQAQKMEALGTLAGGIAHDFNNILSAIGGNAQLALADLPPGSPACTSIAEIELATARAGHLVRQILAFSRQEDAQRRPIALEPIVKEALKLLRATLPAMIEIRMELALEASQVSADATQIHQLILNLGTNAAHAIGERRGTLEVRLDTVTVTADRGLPSAELSPGRYVRLSVSDDGCGMDPAMLDRIFDPFFTTKARGQGTGLGLSVVHGIMEGHGGAITVQTALGKGTTFQLYFPAVTDAIAEAAVPAPPDVVPGRGEHVLYVDDEASLVYLAERALRRLGYLVTGYTDPLEALQAFRSRPAEFDVVFTDLSMPGMSGYSLAYEVLQIRPEVPIVLMSGYLRPEDVEAAKRFGIREVILKPNTIDVLSGALDGILRDRNGAR